MSERDFGLRWAQIYPALMYVIMNNLSSPLPYHLALLPRARRTDVPLYINWCTFVHTHKYFPNRIISIRNQIVFIVHRLILDSNGTDSVRLLFQINRKMANTIWFAFDLIRFAKDFSVCDNLVNTYIYSLRNTYKHIPLYMYVLFMYFIYTE